MNRKPRRRSARVDLACAARRRPRRAARTGTRAGLRNRSEPARPSGSGDRLRLLHEDVAVSVAPDNGARSAAPRSAGIHPDEHHRLRAARERARFEQQQIALDHSAGASEFTAMRALRDALAEPPEFSRFSAIVPRSRRHRAPRLAREREHPAEARKAAERVALARQREHRSSATSRAPATTVRCGSEPGGRARSVAASQPQACSRRISRCPDRRRRSSVSHSEHAL
jgi:hypothetical protein